MDRLSVIDALFSPVLSMIRSVPVASVIILALVWIGRQQIPPFIAFLMVFPVVSTSVKTGLGSVDQELAELLQLLMDKYTFKNVEHSWTKLCYYYETLGPKG